ncbi:MAG: hypothetical protein IJC11_05410, partial [Alphaproteobacteria bacterium]|nr:hypothetical protein [Alphaproteobacteria bacterium]
MSERRGEEPEKRVRSRSVSEVDVRQDSPLGRGQKSEQSLHPLQKTSRPEGRFFCERKKGRRTR